MDAASKDSTVFRRRATRVIGGDGESAHHPATPRHIRTSEDGAKSESYPDLSIVVTMSEDDDDECVPTALSDVLLDDHDPLPLAANESWAMMEQYCEQEPAGWKETETSGELVTALLDTSLISLPTDFESPPTPTRRTSSRLVDATPRHMLQCWQRHRNTVHTPETVMTKPLLLSDDEAEAIIDESEFLPQLDSYQHRDTELEPISESHSKKFFQASTPKSSEEKNKVYFENLAELEQMVIEARKKADKEAEERYETEQRPQDFESLVSSVRKPRTVVSGHHEAVNILNIPSHDSLWERNKTLVKEVRFADQTCVELSGQKLALEKEVSLLKQQLNQLREENTALRRDKEELYYKHARTEADCEILKSRVEAMETAAAPSIETVEQNKIKVELLESENVTMRQKIHESVVAATVAEERCSVLKRHVGDYEDAQRQHLVEIERLQQQLSMTTAEKDQLFSDLVSVRAQLDDKNLEIQRQGEIRKQITTLKDTRIAELERSNADASEDTRMLRSQLDDFLLLTQTLQSQEHSLRSQLHDAEENLSRHQRTAEKTMEGLKELLRERQSQLDEANMALASLQSNIQSQNKHISHSMHAAFEHITGQSEDLEIQWSQDLDTVNQRLEYLKTAVQYIRESIIFESEDSDVITPLEGSPGDGSEVQRPSVSIDQSSYVNGTVDLELMEEARLLTAETSAEDGGEGSPEFASATDVLGPNDTVSSIAGASLVFSEETTSMLFSIPSPGDHMYTAKFAGLTTNPQNDQEFSIISSQGECITVTDETISKNLRRNIEVLQDRLDLVSSKLTLTLEELSSVRVERDHSIKLLDMLTIKNDRLKKSSDLAIAVFEEEKRALAALNAEQLEELDAERRETTVLKTNLKTALEESASLRLAVGDLQTDTKDKEGRLEQTRLELQSSLSAIELEHRDLQSKLEHAQVTISQLCMDKQKLQTDLAGKISELEMAKEISDNLQVELNESKLNLQKVHKCLMDREALEHQMKADVEILQKEVASKDSELASHRKELEILQANFDFMRSSSEKLFQDKTDGDKELASKIDELESIRKDWQRLTPKLEEAEQALSEAHSRLVESTAALTRTEHEKQQMQHEVLNKQAELDVVHKEGESLMAELAEYSRKSQEFEHLKQRLEEEAELVAQEKNEAIETLKMAVAHLRSESEQNCRRADSVEYENQRLHESINHLETELRDLKSSYMDCNERLARLSVLNKQLEETLNESKRMQQAADDLASHAEDRFVRAQNELEAARAAHQSVEANNNELTATCEHLKNDLRLRQAKLHAQAEELQAAEANLSKYEKELSNKNAEVNDIKAVEASREIDMLTALINDKAVEVDTLRDELNEAQRFSSEVSAELIRATQSLNEKDREIKQLFAAKDAAESKCLRLREYVRSLAAKCDQWESFYDQEADVLERLKLANDRTRQKVVEIARRYQERDQVYTTEKAMWTSERSTWQLVHNQLEGELDGIAKELNNFHRF